MGGVFPVLIHIHRFQGLIHPFADFQRRNPQILRSKSHILLHHAGHQLVIRILLNQAYPAAHFKLPCLVLGIDTVDKHTAGGRQQHAVKKLGHCGLAAAVMPQKRYKFARLYGQIDPMQHFSAVHGFRII